MYKKESYLKPILVQVSDFSYVNKGPQIMKQDFEHVGLPRWTSVVQSTHSR